MSHLLWRVAAAAAVLAAMLGVAACGGEEDTSGRQRLDLKIGSLIPRTGFLEQFAGAGQQAGDLAADEIRKAAAKAGAPHKLTITYVDYKSLPGTAQQEASNLVRAGSRCLVGPYGTGQVERVAKQTAIPRKVPLISPAASGSSLTSDEDRGYVFRTVPSDPLQADALVELLDTRLRGARGKEVNVGALDSTYGKELMKEFRDTWQAKGGKVGKEVSYSADQSTFEQQDEFKKQVNDLAQGDPDAWVFFDFQDTYMRAASSMLAQADAGFSPRKAFGTDSLATARLASAANVSNGLRGVAISAPAEGATAEEFDKRFKARGTEKRQTFDAQQFDAVVLCYLAAVAAGTTKGSAIKDQVRAVSAPPGRKFTWLQLDLAIKALEAGQDIDYEGASGPVDLNGDGDASAGVYDVYQFKNGQLETAEQISVPERPGGI
jgi:branched-chain amino acid transport system substrate-binding protein